MEPRPSPHPRARKTGNASVTGRGLCIVVRNDAYWVGIAEIAVTPTTGAVQVTKFAIGVDCGKIINPRQLDRCMKSGVVMGLSEALKEEVTFDKSKVTSTNWTRYKILTMEETRRSRSSRSPAMIKASAEAQRPLTHLALQQSLPPSSTPPASTLAASRSPPRT